METGRVEAKAARLQLRLKTSSTVAGAKAFVEDLWGDWGQEIVILCIPILLNVCLVLMGRRSEKDEREGDILGVRPGGLREPDSNMGMDRVQKEG